MSSNIVFPTLSKWAEERVTALFTTTDEESFNGLYNATFAKDVKITVNGHHLSREQHRKQLLADKRLEIGAQVAFAGAVEVSDNKEHPENSGNVGLFVHATVDQRFIVFGAPQSSTVTASYNLTIIADGPFQGGDFDNRKISVLSEVSVDKRNPGPRSVSH